ncbi:MAG: SsrA-binding protein, partial [Erysipelotrichaceae bacterium]|nr:SsrA-binding protein [Erysipelotrichaceae bacterium]
NQFNHDETRIRKLLLNKSELRKLQNKVKLKGYTIVPTKLYLKNGRAKMEIALAKGKALYDKREVSKQRDIQRQLNRVMKNHF